MAVIDDVRRLGTDPLEHQSYDRIRATPEFTELRRRYAAFVVPGTLWRGGGGPALTGGIHSSHVVPQPRGSCGREQRPSVGTLGGQQWPRSNEEMP